MFTSREVLRITNAVSSDVLNQSKQFTLERIRETKQEIYNSLLKKFTDLHNKREARVGQQIRELTDKIAAMEAYHKIEYVEEPASKKYKKIN